MKNKNRKYIVYVLLLILCISIGYAALSTTLNITGVSNINSAKWDIHFENVKVSDTSVTATSPAAIDAAKTTVNYSVRLPKPGDSYTFTVDVVNAGTIDAMISEVINTSLEADTKKYLDYTVNYANGLSVAVKDQLKAGETVKMQVSVKYKTDLNASDLPTEDKPLDLSFRVTYIQADDTSNAITSNPIMNSDTTGNYHSDTYKSKVTKISTKKVLSVPDTAIESWDVSVAQDGSIKAYVEDNGAGGYNVTICADGEIYLNPSSKSLFSGFTNLTTLDLSNINTKCASDISLLITGCSNLVNLSLPILDTTNLTNMNGAFAGCSSLKSIKLQTLNKKSKLQDMGGLFSSCSALTSIDIKSLDTSKVTNISGIFGGMSSITSIDMSNMNLSSASAIGGLVSGCSSLETLNLSGVNFSNLMGVG